MLVTLLCGDEAPSSFRERLIEPLSTIYTVATAVPIAVFVNLSDKHGRLCHVGG